MPVPAAPPTPSAQRPVDERALARWRQRLQAAAQPPWLHGEAARRMAERLAVVRLQPTEVLDWGLRPGDDAPLLRLQYPQARLRAVAAAPVAEEKRPWWRAAFGRTEAPLRVGAADIAPGSAQLVWSTMALHAEADPRARLRAWQQALAVDGFLMFCTVGPGTLGALAALYAEQGWGPPLAPLVDMHDLGDMLVEAGFADPVMDQETLTLTWPDAASALAELRSLGANAAPARQPGLRTPRWRERLLQALGARHGADGRVALAFELVYGHAFKPPPRARLAAETAVPLDDLRAMVRRPPPRRA
jgi:malonyl-CoA O-methyltransferase